jgi:hypothetical protein
MSKDMITGRASVPGMVRAGLDRDYAARRGAEVGLEASQEEFAASLDLTAALYERDVRWWSVLRRWFETPEAQRGYEVFGSGFEALFVAVLAAHSDAEHSAEHYRELARSVRARLAHAGGEWAA